MVYLFAQSRGSSLVPRFPADFLQVSDLFFRPLFAFFLIIKGSGNSFQNRMVDLFHQIMTAVKSSPCRSWVDYTTTTEKEHEVWCNGKRSIFSNGWAK